MLLSLAELESAGNLSSIVAWLSHYLSLCKTSMDRTIVAQPLASELQYIMHLHGTRLFSFE